jgi:hypothetical protein
MRKEHETVQSPNLLLVEVTDPEPRIAQRSEPKLKRVRRGLADFDRADVDGVILQGQSQPKVILASK